MSKIIINGKADGALKAYKGGDEIAAMCAGGSRAYRKMETGTQPGPPSNKFLCFTAQQAGSTVSFVKEGVVSISVPVLYKSTDGNNWTTWDGSTITLPNVNSKVYIYGDNTSFRNGTASSIIQPNTYWHFSMSGIIAASGDITTMLDMDGVTGFSDTYTFYRMFQGCTGLTTPPELPAIGLSAYCYYDMFSGCSSLTTAPELPATVIPRNCYQRMFSGCTSLTTSPVISASSIATNCCENMFQGCTSLTTAPALPATTLANYCYQSMFSGCTSLTTAPALPATTLAPQCYANMFVNCTALTTAPALPATTLANNCYRFMFQGCTSLNHIEVSATIWNTSYATNWVSGVAATGTFVNNGGIVIPVGTNGIPSGWTEVGPKSITISGAGDTGYTYQIGSGQPQTVTAGSGDVAVKVPDGSSITLTSSSASSLIYSGNYELGTTVTIPFADIAKVSRFECWAPDTNYLCLMANEANSTVGMAKEGTSDIEHTLYISTDGTNWSQWDFSTVTLANVGDKLYIKGDGNKSLMGTAITTYYYFTMGGSIAASGNATTLLTTKPQPQMERYTFAYLFNNCTALTTAPALPATTLAHYCYRFMFYGCTSLTTAPALPATTLGSYCYSNMFYGCTSLTTAPELPATTLAQQCYANMFVNCTALTTVPALPATTLAQGCYANMFNGCTSLNSVKCLAENISASNCTSYWLNGVSATGTFTKSANMNNWPTGDSGIPEGWTVVDAS